MIRAVIFDLDGVLTDSEPVINAAAIAGLREYGIDPRPEDFHPFAGAGARAHGAHLPCQPYQQCAKTHYLTASF
jgi:beta-phosphoglucomutase-like phosphatase (HAD superfamily)